MNFKFIEGGKTCNKVVEFRGLGVAYKEVVHRQHGRDIVGHGEGHAG